MQANMTMKELVEKMSFIYMRMDRLGYVYEREELARCIAAIEAQDKRVKELVAATIAYRFDVEETHEQALKRRVTGRPRSRQRMRDRRIPPRRLAMH